MNITNRRQPRDEVLAAMYETAAGSHDIGVVDKKTMREIDELCLAPVEVLTAKQILALREREQVSQAVFARYLNVSTGLISQWERGEKRPTGPSLKLLSLVQRKGLAAIL